MYNTALRIVDDHADAEDVMQEAFLKAFERVRSYESKASFGAWLKRIVVNESISWLRKNGKWKLTPDGEMQDIPVDEIEIEIFSGTQISKVLETMQKLKENYRILIQLYYLEGYDYEELTQILGLSYANLRTMMSRAKKSLKMLFQQEKISSRL